tara:strand:+ start:2648 stop:2995 length:348 start_codon:yes stop_codon:yes gene_type:complete
MNYFLTIVILTLISSLGYSQTAKEIEEQKKSTLRVDQQSISQNKITTLSLNLIGVSKNNQGALKDEFLSYKRQIVSLDYDEFTETMVIKYSGLSDEKIASLLDKHQISISAIVIE